MTATRAREGTLRGNARPRAPSPLAPTCHGQPLAVRRRAHLVALHVAHACRCTAREAEGRSPDDGPPELPAACRLDEVLHPPAGAGPLFHRRYRGRIREAEMGARELVRARSATTSTSSHRASSRASPRCAARRAGWRSATSTSCACRGRGTGPVRVIEKTPTSFRFVTLEGHLEAGQIRFQARDGELLEFTIESWARAGDRLSNLLFDQLRMSKEIQLHMWTSTIQRVAELSGGRLTGGIEIRTRRVETGLSAGSRGAARQGAELRAAAGRGVHARARLARRRAEPGRCTPRGSPGRSRGGWSRPTAWPIPRSCARRGTTTRRCSAATCC